MATTALTHRPSLVRRPDGLDQRLVELPVPALAAAALGLIALALAGAVLGERGPTPGPVGMTATLAFTFAPFGVFVLRRLPGHPLGRLMLFTGVTAAVATLSVCWSALVPVAWLSQWSWWPPLAAIPLTLLLVPDGQPPTGVRRVLGVVIISAAAVTTLILAGAALVRPTTLLTTLEPLPPGMRLTMRVAAAGVGVVVLGAVGALITLLGRWRAADALARRQLACLLPSAVLLAVGLGLDFDIDVPYSWVPAVVALPLGLTVAVLRYRWHDLDLYIHRGAIWVVLSGLAAAVYAGSATALGWALAPTGSYTTTLVSVAAVVAVMHPAERLVRRAIGRLLYGHRDDPYSVLAQQGRHLENTTDPLAVLPRFVASLVDGLRVPYAAIALHEPDGCTRTAAEYGRRVGPPRPFPMTVQGTEVGLLLVAPRRAGEQFPAAELRLLRDLAAQAGQAAVACRSTLALQRARESLVLAREEERRRLRRDLHDGVASGLVGARMLAEAARQSTDERTRALVDTLAAGLEACTAEIRDLVDGLRPAALDDGLEPALRALTERLPEPAPRFTLRVSGRADRFAGRGRGRHVPHRRGGGHQRRQARQRHPVRLGAGPRRRPVGGDRHRRRHRSRRARLARGAARAGRRGGAVLDPVPGGGVGRGVRAGPHRRGDLPAHGPADRGVAALTAECGVTPLTTDR